MKGCYKTPKGAKGSSDTLIYNLIWTAFAATLLPSLGVKLQDRRAQNTPLSKGENCMASVLFHAIDCAED